MFMKLTVVGCLMVLTVLNSTPPVDAFGLELLGQLSELLFGSDESDESTETVINAKPNANVTVVCEKECNLNVTCINCNKVDTTMMKPSNGNGGGTTTPPAGMPAAPAGMPTTTTTTTTTSTTTMAPTEP